MILLQAAAGGCGERPVRCPQQGGGPAGGDGPGAVLGAGPAAGHVHPGGGLRPQGHPPGVLPRPAKEGETANQVNGGLEHGGRHVI